MSRITKPVQITPRLHIVYSEFPHVHSGNVYLVSGARPVLIDCGSPHAVPALLGNLAKLDLSITDIDLVVATHGDYDHTQGYHTLRERNPRLSLAIHPLDQAAVVGNDAYTTSSYVYELPFVPLSREHCHMLHDGDLIPAGDGQLRVVHAPGHTAGSICLHGEIDGHQVLIAGDVYGGAMKSVRGADPLAWIEAFQTWSASLDRLAGLEFEWVLNGHEPAAGLPILRSEFDRRHRMFGRMLNPWFALGDESSLVDEALPAAQAIYR